MHDFPRRMMMLAGIATLAMATSACSHGAKRGELIGGVAGAVAGSATGIGTVEGAVIGGTAGAVIGDD